MDPSTGNMETGGARSNYAGLSRTGSPVEAREDASLTVKIGPGYRRLYEGLFASQASATAEPAGVMSATAAVEVWGGPAEAESLVYRPDAFANGRVYEFQGRVAVEDLSSFLNAPNSWTPRRYADELDLTEMDKVIGDTGSAYGRIVTGGFVGDEGDGVDGRSVCWAIRMAPGSDRGTLLVYPTTLESRPEGADASKWGRLREISAEAPSPWSALGEVNGAKVADDWFQARVYSGVKAGASLASAFEGGTAATAIDLSRMDWTEVADASRMFAGCGSLGAVRDVAASADAGRDTVEEGADAIEEGAGVVSAPGAITRITSFAEGASSLTSVNLGSNGLLARVTDASRAFTGCGSLASVEISGMSAPSLNAREMLAGAGAASPGGSVRITGSFEGPGTDCARLMPGAGFSSVDVSFGRAGGGVAVTADEALSSMADLKEARVTAHDGCAVSARRMLAGSGSDAGVDVRGGLLGHGGVHGRVDGDG